MNTLDKLKIGDTLYYMHNPNSNDVSTRMLRGTLVEDNISAVTIKSVGRAYYQTNEDSRTRIELGTLCTKKGEHATTRIQLYKTIEAVHEAQLRNDLSRWLRHHMSKVQNFDRYTIEDMQTIKNILSKE